MQTCWIVVRWSDHGGITVVGVYEHEARANEVARAARDVRVRVIEAMYHRYSSSLAETS